MIQIQQAIMPITGNRTGDKMTRKSGVVIHYTGNSGNHTGAWGHKGYVTRRSARVNGKSYECDLNGNADFNRPFAWGAAKYYVDDKNIVQYIPSDEYCAHAGASGGMYFREGITSKIGGGPNFTLESIEMCINPESDFLETVENTAELAAHLLRRDGLGVDCLYRHYDIVNKDCPAMMIDPSAWEWYKAELKCDWIDYMDWSAFVTKVQGYLTPEEIPQIVIPLVIKPLTSKGIVISNNSLNLRDNPINGKVLAEIAPSRVLKIIGVTDDNWYKVEYNEMIGFVCGEYIKIDNGIKVFTNDQEVVFSEASPKIVDGSTYCPLKEIFVSLGWTVSWDETTSVAKFKSPDETQIVSISDKDGISLTKIEKSPAKMYIENGRICGQIRPIFEALGFSVNWDEIKGGAIIK